MTNVLIITDAHLVRGSRVRSDGGGPVLAAMLMSLLV